MAAIQKPIRAIFMVVGKPLRFLGNTEKHQILARERINSLDGGDNRLNEFCNLLEARYKTYRKLAFATLSETSEFELWPRWLLSDYPPEKASLIAG